MVAERDHGTVLAVGRAGSTGRWRSGGRPLLAHGGDGDGRRQREQAGEQHQQQVARPDPAGVQRGHGAGVDQPLADLEPGEVGAGQARSAGGRGTRRGWRACPPPTISAGVARRRPAAGRRPRWWRRSRAAAGGRRAARAARPRSRAAAVHADDHVAGGAQRLGGGRSALAALSPRTTMSAGSPASSSASAPRSTPTSTGSCSRMKRADRGELGRVARGRGRRRPPAGPRSGWPARGSPRPCSSRSCSRRRNSVLLWVKRLQLAGQARRAPVHLGARRSRRRPRGRARPRSSPT